MFSSTGLSSFEHSWITENFTISSLFIHWIFKPDRIPDFPVMNIFIFVYLYVVQAIPVFIHNIQLKFPPYILGANSQTCLFR